MMSLSTTCSISRKRIVVLVGIHGSGKTTLGRKMLDEGLDFFSEIGTVLRYETEKSVNDNQDEFDQKVLSKELERDEKQLLLAARPVVETWHIGNYAFALSRGSSVIKDYDSVLEMQLQKFYPLVFRLKIDDKVFLSRVNEKNITPDEALRFYKKVDLSIQGIIDGLASKGLIESVTYNYPFNYEVIKNEAKRFLMVSGEGLLT